MSNDFKQHRLAALDQQVITEYEKLVSDWISTIEAILHDTVDERLCSFKYPSVYSDTHCLCRNKEHYMFSEGEIHLNA